MIDLLIADDHQLIIDGIKTSLKDFSDINIIGEAKDGLDVLKILETTHADVILMDIKMPKMDGIECLQNVTKKFPKCKVIALSQYDEKRIVNKMIKSGAKGYLLKGTDREELVTAIRRVHANSKYFSNDLYDNRMNGDSESGSGNRLFPNLSHREREILKLICQEYSTTEIAKKLYISIHTVGTHRANLMAKCGVKNTAGLVRWVIENDFLE